MRLSATFARTASATLSLGSIGSNATRARRLSLYDVSVGSEATPADNVFLYLVQRITAQGTSTAVTPDPLDSADFVTESTAGMNHTVDATYTAGKVGLRIPLNQRATFRWVAAPGGELVSPATASNGWGIQTPTMTAVAISGLFHYNEL